MPSDVSSGCDKGGHEPLVNDICRQDARSSSAGSIPLNFVHVHSIQFIYDILLEMRIDPEDIFEKAGADMQMLEAVEAVSFAMLGRLTALAADEARCAHFGLLVGQRTTLASLGLLGTLMRHSATVGAALQALATHHDLLNRGAMIELAVDGAVATVSYAPYEPGTEGVALHCERAVAALTNALRALCGATWSPDEVLLPRLDPPDSAPYTGFFRAPVRFAHEFAALVFPARLLRRSIEGADPLIRASVERRIRQCESIIPSGISDEVRRSVRSRIIQKRIEKDQVAQALAIHQRTLGRRLKAEGTTFRSIANQTRLGIATQLLADTTMSLAQISSALEFSEPAAFTHAFRRWTGMTPSAWRKEHWAG